MLTNLDFIDVVSAPNGPFALCRACMTIIATSPHSYGSDVPFSSSSSLIYRHLRKYHDATQAAALPALIATRPGLAEALENSRHKMPLPLPDRSPRIAGLKILEAYQCSLCPGPNFVRYMSDDTLKRHLLKAHGKPEFFRQVRYRLITVQSWYPNHAGGLGILWEVENPSSTKRNAPVSAPNPDQFVADLYTERSIQGTQKKDDHNPYLARTGWFELLKRRPYLHALRQLTFMPRWETAVELKDPEARDGQLYNAYFESKSESILIIILSSMQEQFQRCSNTFHTTPHSIRHWVCSEYGDKAFRTPFAWLQNTGSLLRYYSHWKRLICFLFRAYLLQDFDISLERQICSVYKYLTNDQKSLIETLWKQAEHVYWRQKNPRHLDSNDPELSYLRSMGSDFERQLSEGLFQLNISLLTTPPATWSTTTSHLLTYFTGILSLDLSNSSVQNPNFVPIAQSTTFLSSLIWIARVLFLEYALPQKPYIEWEQPVRTTYPDPLRQFKKIQKAWMIRDSSSPLSELLQLRSLGRRVRNLNIGRTLLFWSKKDTVVTIGPQSISMSDFRRWVQSLIATSSRQFDVLMRGYSPPNLPRIDTLSESISCNTPGISFLTLPKNQSRLESCTQAFIRAVFTKASGSAWSQRERDNYLIAHDRFLETLLLLIYQTSGQPARGPEILSVKVCNTTNTPRNIFIYQGQFCLVTQYNKSRTNNTLPFYIIRFLPSFVGQLLYKYLVYIRPFVRYLQTTFNYRSPRQPQYLWARNNQSTEDPKEIDTESTQISDQFESEEDDDLDSEEDDQNPKQTSSASYQGYWTTEYLTRALQESSRKQELSMIFTVSLYRQVAIGIMKKHLGQTGQPSSRTMKESGDEQALHKIFAWQAGHSIAQEMESYGLDGDFPSRLQPLLFKLYHGVSQTWHEWLGLHSPPIPTRPSTQQPAQPARVEDDMLLDSPTPDDDLPPNPPFPASNTPASVIIIEDDAPADSTPLAVSSTPPPPRFDDDAALNSGQYGTITVAEPPRLRKESTPKRPRPSSRIMVLVPNYSPPKPAQSIPEQRGRPSRPSTIQLGTPPPSSPAPAPSRDRLRRSFTPDDDSSDDEFIPESSLDQPQRYAKRIPAQERDQYRLRPKRRRVAYNEG